MKVIFSTAYLGPIEYYIEYIKCDNPILETNENYQKQSYRNRCSIMSANNILNLIIPVKKPKILNNRNKRTPSSVLTYSTLEIAAYYGDFKILETTIEENIYLVDKAFF